MTGGAGFVRDAQNTQRRNLSQLDRTSYTKSSSKTGSSKKKPYVPQPPDPQKLAAYQRRLAKRKRREKTGQLLAIGISLSIAIIVTLWLVLT